MIVETEAIVLHSMNLGDTSKIVTLYSKKFGKIKVVAKGARNPKKNSFGSSLEPMSHTSVVFYKKESRDLHLLSKSEIVTPMNGIQARPESLLTGLALVEVVTMVMHGENEHPALFDELLRSLAAVNSARSNVTNVLPAFLIRLFDEFGCGLSVSACAGCGKNPVSEGFSSALLRLSDGSILCAACAEEQFSGGVPLSAGGVKSLYYLMMHPIEKSVSLSMVDSVKEELFAVLTSYMRYHIDGVRTLRSLSLLYSMDQNKH